jgi:hypothetical protein
MAPLRFFSRSAQLAEAEMKESRSPVTGHQSLLF